MSKIHFPINNKLFWYLSKLYLNQVSQQKSDQSQLCITSSGEGKGAHKLNKREESSYLDWSCNEHGNQDSNNSGQSTATTGTNKSSNGNVTKLPESKINYKSKKFSFSSKSQSKKNTRFLVLLFVNIKR